MSRPPVCRSARGCADGRLARLPIGTFGAIQTSSLGPDRYRAWTRFRDWDGQTRQVTVTAASRNAAITLLKAELTKRMHAGDFIDSVNASLRRRRRGTDQHRP